MKMKTLFYLVLSFLMFFSSGPTYAGDVGDSSERELNSAISRLITRFKIPSAHSSIIISDLRSGEEVYSLNPDLPLKPASNMKIVTTAAALGLLNPEYQFSTGVFADAEIENGILTGNIYLKGFGDPFLVPEFLWDLARLTSIKGIEEVSGHLIVDESFFDTVRYPDSDWQRIKMPLWYNAPTGPLSFNFNAISVWATPGERSGDPITVKTDPACGYFIVENSAVTSSPGNRNRLILDLKEEAGFCHLLLTGSMPAGYNPQQYFRHIKNPSMYCGHAFLHYLRQNGIAIGDKIVMGTVPENAEELVVHKSHPLSSLLRSASKFSNNFMMEQTLKTMGAVCHNTPGTTAKGAQAVKSYLLECGISVEGFRMNDGSGLSRNNRTTSRQLADLIRYVVREATYSPEFMNALPIAGVDGTMKKRLNGNGDNRLVRAKTGVIDGVCALSEIIDGRKDNGLVFSILVNNNRNRHRDVKKFQDEVVSRCLDYLHGREN